MVDLVGLADKAVGEVVGELRGLHVVVAMDAVTSWSPAGHRAALEAIYPRFDRQVELAAAGEIMAAWPGD